MNVPSIFLVSFGLIFISISLKPAIKIYKQESSIGWASLCLLIVFFFFGYSSFFYHLITATKATSLIEFYLSSILFCGSLFVFIVINFSLRSFEKLHRFAKQEHHNAMHDSLTGLPNQLFFTTALSDKILKSVPFAVFTFDLNKFKQVNDVAGHFYGDQLLVEFSERLSVVLPKECSFSRVGGDEFSLLFDSIEDAEINELVTAIGKSLTPSFKIKGYDFYINVSTGVSLFPLHSDDIDLLLQKSDAAMYESKKLQVPYRLYNDSLDKNAKARLVISNNIHSALENNEFQLYYQPIVKLEKAGKHHFEALIRWPQSDGSFIQPDKFIPIAEENGSIRQITLWVLNNIIEHLILFSKLNINACIHINLSARDLQNDYFLAKLISLVNENKLSPTQLILEVTETAILTDLKKTTHILDELSAQGFKISLDDFGTGFSSLNILRKLPINQIKIDRTFVMAMNSSDINDAIVRSIITLAKNIGCSVVAEGVETKEIASELISLRCDYLQGYYYCKPLPLTEILSRSVQSNPILNITAK